jgi:hypothetical protein
MDDDLREKKDDENIRFLCGVAWEKFHQNNERIWKVGSIFIPVSFTPLAAVLGKDKVPQLAMIVLALASVLTYGFWLMVAETHRRFQGLAEKEAREFEKMLGFTFSAPEPRGGITPNLKTIRWCLLLALILIWGLVIWKLT